MPKNTHMVSLDFGGGIFTRESDFFAKFDTHIIKTNVRRDGSQSQAVPYLDVDKNSWHFMGFGAILYRDYLKADKIIFGTILEARLHAVKKGAQSCGIVNFPFKNFGLSVMHYVGGLTEVATALMCEYYGMNIVEDSLTSLASPGSAKFYRKQLLIHCAREKLAQKSIRREWHYPKQPQIFGAYMADDFLIFYIYKKFGIEIALRLVERIPIEVIQLCDGLSLEFYEKVMPEMLQLSAADDSMAFYKKLEVCGVLPFNDNDWEEYRQVMNILRTYYPTISTNLI